MSDLYIFDPYDNLLAVLSNNSEGACPFWDAPFGERINQGSTFEFTTTADHEDARSIVAQNQVAFKDKDGAFRLFVISEPEKINDSSGPTIRAVCAAAMLELNDEIIKDVRPYNTTLKDSVTRALSGTRWKVGEIAELGLNSTNFYYINVTEAITQVINTWGGELRDRVEIKDNKITGRFIDILPRRGVDTGKRWEIDKDILKITNRTQSYPKTALWGRGSSVPVTDDDNSEVEEFTRKITFADVVWSVANGDPVNKPAGQEWVGDPTALELYGRKNDDGSLRHRNGVYESSDQEDPKLLLKETWEALQEQKKPIENYEMDVFLLQDLTGYDHEKVRLGDTTFAIDRSFSKPIEVEERIISFEYDISDPDNSGVVELGNFIDLYSDDDRLDQIEAKLNDNTGIWNNGGNKPITDGKIENITPAKPENVIATGLFQNVLVEWDFVNALYIANYEVYASQVSGFAPDISNLAWKGKSSMYTHKANRNEQWYFRVRAVNTHGVAGPLSEQVTANTARIISDDILFGVEVAAELRELSKTAKLLADGTIDDKLMAAGSITAQNAAIAALAVGAAAIQNLSVTNGKLDNLSVGQAQIQDLAVTNAKIANLAIDNAKIANISADKIKVGTLNGIDITGVTINGSTIISRSGGTETEISGGEFHTSGSFTRTFGNNTASYTAFIDSYDGALRARITEKRVNGVKKNTQERWLTFTDKTITSQREVHSGSVDYKNARFIDFFADETLNGDVAGLGMHIYSGQNTLIEAAYNMDIKTGANQYLTIDSGGGVAIESNNNILSLRRKTPYTSESGSLLTFQSSDKTWQGAVGIPNDQRNMHVTSYFGDYIILRSSSETHVKDTENNSFMPIRSSEYRNGSSITYKTNIEDLENIGLDIINKLQVKKYVLQSDVDSGVYDNWQVGVISELSPEVATPEGLAVNMYKMLSYSVKAIQEQQSIIDSLEQRVSDLEMIA
ncbi:MULTISPECIES: phage tail spike protein [Peribacillus]|uniref:phage tail spike protein n=1 Tax=Peribacillus TaxID=2675229 RepID=UPI001F4E3021|nr:MULTISPECIES: phage tail spike protein [unclassified Peribacillus]MCK1982237.1 phage tail protein [Peribacillus sp. Aquil_B1]MCK2007411.1 phage tail protein [Peribacillus sp. Aquil_B8]